MKNLMLLRDKMLGFSTPADAPVTFAFDGMRETGIDSDKKPSVRSFVTDSAVKVTEITAVASKGLILNVRETLYSDFPVVEWGAEMTSFARAESERLSDFGISAVLRGTSPRLVSGSGDTRNDGVFKRFPEREITEEITVAPDFCRGADGASPFMTVKFDEYTVKMGVGFPGKWKMVFAPAEGGVRFTLTQASFNTVLYPGETMRTPNITVLFSDNDVARATNLWRRFFLKHILPVGKNGEKIPSGVNLRST